MTDRRALFLSLAERVEKLDGHDPDFASKLTAILAPICGWSRRHTYHGWWVWCSPDGRECAAAPDFLHSHDAVNSLPGPEVVYVYLSPDNVWVAYASLGDGREAEGEAPTRLLAELAARLRAMAETVKEENHG